MSTTKRKSSKESSSSKDSTDKPREKKESEVKPKKERETGVICVLRDSYGFIECGDKKEQRFFHFSQYPGPVKDELKVGDSVEFLMKKDSKTKRMLATELIKLPELLEDSEDRVCGCVLKAIPTGTTSKKTKGKQESGIILYKSHGEGFHLPYEEEDWDLPTELPKVGDKVTFIIGCDKGTGNLHARLVRHDPGPCPRKRYRGIINTMRSNFAFVERPNVTEHLFIHQSEVKGFSNLAIGDPVEFNISTRDGKEVGTNVTAVRPHVTSFVQQLGFDDVASGPGFNHGSGPGFNQGGGPGFNQGGGPGFNQGGGPGFNQGGGPGFNQGGGLGFNQGGGPGFNQGGGPGFNQGGGLGFNQGGSRSGFNQGGGSGMNDWASNSNGGRGSGFLGNGRESMFNNGSGDRYQSVSGGEATFREPLLNNYNEKPRILADSQLPVESGDNLDSRGVTSAEDALLSNYRRTSVSSVDLLDGPTAGKRARKDDSASQTKSSQPVAERDRFTVFGEHVACQLRELNDVRRQAMAENRINNILFDVTMEKIETAT